MKEIDNDQIAWDAFENPAELYRLWKEKENLLAGQFLANKYHWGDEKNGIFINPEKAREIYEEIGESYEDSVRFISPMILIGEELTGEKVFFLFPKPVKFSRIFKSIPSYLIIIYFFHISLF